MKLTLGFSAMVSRIKTLLDSIPELDPTTFEVLIALQGKASTAQSLRPREGIRVFHLNSIGLSRSRNAIIQHATGKYIWFLDDDIRLARNAAEIVANWLTEHDDIDVLQVRIGSMDCPDRPYKTYTARPITRLNLLQLSSIEMIVRTAFIKQHNLRFPEEIGLGTKFAAGEENWFALDLYDACASFARLPETLVYHRTLEERWKPNNEIFFVRGATSARFGLLAPVLIARWWIRTHTTESLTAMLRGMFAYFIHKEHVFKSQAV